MSSASSTSISSTSIGYETLLWVTTNVFGGSQAGDTKIIISDIQSSNNTILNDVNFQQKEIDTSKSNINNLHVKIQLLENNIQTSNKSIFYQENRMSELINKYDDRKYLLRLSDYFFRIF